MWGGTPIDCQNDGVLHPWSVTVLSRSSWSTDVDTRSSRCVLRSFNAAIMDSKHACVSGVALDCMESKALRRRVWRTLKREILYRTNYIQRHGVSHTPLVPPHSVTIPCFSPVHVVCSVSVPCSSQSSCAGRKQPCHIWLGYGSELLPCSLECLESDPCAYSLISASFAVPVLLAQCP